ncbi:unnamed protein product [Nesidiocoris tenuis]|uniref:Uncharacterized protein n=1 Tax=Nesidiocoris tenuis TaxID=355587 RepID=A0A6H5H499_9HEMI|nr:unnamed protein product [Nesidiocoris tenuis]
MEFKKQSNARQRKRFLPYDLNPNISVRVGIQVVLFVGRSDEARRMLVAASAVGVQLSYGGVWMLDLGKWSRSFGVNRHSTLPVECGSTSQSLNVCMLK